MPQKVYLVRHGESEDGAKAIYQRNESSLSPEGIKQAEVLGRRFSSIPVDVIYSSPFSRAKETAEIIKKDRPELDFVLIDELRELKRPSVVIGKPLNDPEVLKIKKELRENSHNKDWHHSDEENFYDIRARAKLVLDRIEKEERSDVLVVSHSMVLRVLSMLMAFGRDAGHDIHEVLYNHFRMTPTGITLFENTTKGWMLMTWNDYAHLGEDTSENFYRNRQDI